MQKINKKFCCADCDKSNGQSQRSKTHAREVGKINNLSRNGEDKVREFQHLKNWQSFEIAYILTRVS